MPQVEVELELEEEFGITYPVVEHAIRMWIAETNPTVQQKLKLIHTIRSAEEVFERPYEMVTASPRIHVDDLEKRSINRFHRASVFKAMLQFVDNSPWDSENFWDLVTHLEDFDRSKRGAAYEMIAMLFNLLKDIDESEK